MNNNNCNIITGKYIVKTGAVVHFVSDDWAIIIAAHAFVLFDFPSCVAEHPANRY